MGTYSKVVLERISRRNLALRHTHRAVHVRCSILVHAVKMQGSRLITKLVVDVDDDTIADICLDTRNGPLVIDANDGAWERSVWIGSDPSNVEVIVDSGRAGKAQRGGKQSRRSCEAVHLLLSSQDIREASSLCGRCCSDLSPTLSSLIPSRRL